MIKISPMTYRLLTAKSGEVFEVGYKQDVPKRTCAKRGVHIVRKDYKNLNRSYVIVL